MRKFRVVVLLATLILLLAACGGGDAGSGASAPVGESGDAAAPPAAQDITILGKDIAYEPTEISGEVGQPLNITLENTGALEHNITWEESDELFIDTQAGESADGTITFDEAGEYGFYCSVAGHREAGMVGTVTIQ